MDRESQPLVEMLSEHLAGIAQFQQATPNVVDTLLVCRRSVPLAIDTREPIGKHRILSRNQIGDSDIFDDGVMESAQRKNNTPAA
jgi:hypothetical protein